MSRKMLQMKRTVVRCNPCLPRVKGRVDAINAAQVRFNHSLEGKVDELMLLKLEKNAKIQDLKIHRRLKLGKDYKESISKITRKDIQLEQGQMIHKDVDGHYFDYLEGTKRAVIDDFISNILTELNILKQRGELADSRILLETIEAKGKEFTGDEHFREVYNHYISGNYLNYAKSPITKFTSGTTTGATEYRDLRPELDEIFKIELQHDLLFLVAHLLLNSSPRVSDFTHLCDLLHNENLHVYETIVLQHLVPYKFKTSLLALPFEDNLLITEYYQSVVEVDPSFVITLFKYFDRLENATQIINLMKFLNITEVNELAEYFNRSKYQALISKSRFLKFKPQLPNITYTQFKKLGLNKSQIYYIIALCIKHKQFHYIDSIINKIIFQSIHGGETVLLSLNNAYKDGFVIDTDDIDLIVKTVFTQDLVILLIDAINESDDMGRLLWLSPHIDKVVALFDPPVIQKIIDCLMAFGIEGKAVTYRNLI